jgi:hypothetical protein
MLSLVAVQQGSPRAAGLLPAWLQSSMSVRTQRPPGHDEGSVQVGARVRGLQDPQEVLERVDQLRQVVGPLCVQRQPGQRRMPAPERSLTSGKADSWSTCEPNERELVWEGQDEHSPRS